MSRGRVGHVIAFAYEQPPDKGYFASATTAAYWFPSVDLGGWKDELLFEHAMTLFKGFGSLQYFIPKVADSSSATAFESPLSCLLRSSKSGILQQVLEYGAAMTIIAAPIRRTRSSTS